MNVEELRELAQTIVDDVERVNLKALLTQLRDTVQAQVGSPGSPDAQTAVATARDNLSNSLRAGAVDEFNAHWRALMDEMGLEFLRPEVLLAELDDLFLQNQVTPQVVYDELAGLVTRVTDASDHLQRLIGALDYLHIESAALGAGEFEASVMIPRAEVDNSLGHLGREFQDLETLIRPFLEAATGTPPPIQVRQIASSDFLAVVALAPGAALLLSKALDGVLAVYERVLNIRRLRHELSESGLKDETVETIEQDATEMVDRDIPAIVQSVMESAAALPTDSGRRNEIEVALNKSVRGLAKRVDLGFRMTVRSGPPIDDEDGSGDGGTDNGSNRAELAAIREIVVANQRRAELQELVGEPILRELSAGSDITKSPDKPARRASKSTRRKPPARPAKQEGA